MTSLAGTGRRLDPDILLARVGALDRFLRAVDGHLPQDDLVPARTVVDRAGQRLALSRDHTVVALAGSTGSGKSSLFNAFAGMDLSPVGARRPTTSATYACVWGTASAGAELLDWLGVLPAHRFTRESALDGDDEVPLRGLVLLDLPDFDSVEASHRAEADRLLGLVDLVVWVMDPQKYADKLVHVNYLRRFPRHRDVTVVALNQADRLSARDRERCLADLRSLLDADGLAGVATLASSAHGAPGREELRARLVQAVAARQAVLHRLAADIERVAAGLSTVVSSRAVGDEVTAGAAARLSDALADAVGVPGLIRAAEHSYRQAAAHQLAWPPLRLLRRPRPDPFGRATMPDRETADGPAAATGTGGQPAAVGLAVRAVAERAADKLPPPWPAATSAAARARLDDLIRALDRVVADSDAGRSRTSPWWRLVATVQWLTTLAAVAGLGALLAGHGLPALGLPALGLPAPAYPSFGPLPLPALSLITGVLLGVAITVLGRPALTSAARRARARAEADLRAAVADVAREYVIAPVNRVLSAYEQARAALTAVLTGGDR